MKKKGIILELRTKEAIVVNDLCEYEKIKRVEGMFEGQMVEYSTPSQTKVFRHVAAVSSVAAALVLIVVGYLIFIMNMNPKVYAYVDLDINPSMEFLIDKNNSVIDLKSLNSDAEGLISTSEVKEKNINDAISYILKRLESNGYISSDNENLILLAASYSEDSETAENTIEKTINTIKKTIENSDNKNIQVKVIYVEPNLRKKSIDNNMSMGRYVLYKNAQKIGADITPNDAKSAKVKDLISYYRQEDSLPPVSNVSNSMSATSDLPAIRKTQSDLDKSNKEEATSKSNDTSNSVKPPMSFFNSEESNEDKALTQDNHKNDQGGSGIPPVLGDPKKPLETYGIPPIFDNHKRPKEGSGVPPIPNDPKKPPERASIPPISDGLNKPQEGSGIPPIPVDPKRPPEGPGILPVFDDPKKPPEGSVAPPITVDPKRPPEGSVAPPITVDPKRPPEGSVTPPITVDPKRPPEGSVTPPITVDPKRPTEEPVAPPITVDPKRPTEEPVAPPITVDPKRPPEGSVAPPIPVDPKRAPEGPVAPPIPVDPKRAPEGPVAPPITVDPKRPPEGPVAPPITVDPKRPPVGPVAPPITVDPKRPPEGPVAPPIPVDPKRPPEGSGIPPVFGEPKRPQ